MKNNRLFEILYLLSNKRQLTAKYLAEYFEVSVRTIYRDIETLSMAGVPLYTDRGKGGGIKLMDHYLFDQAIFSQSEQDQILIGLKLLSKLNEKDHATYQKFISIFDNQQQDWIHIEMNTWRNKHHLNILQTYKDAIINHQLIQFDYHSQNGQLHKRIVEPLQILIKNFQYYLIAYDTKKQSQRIYKLTRINQLQLTEKCFKPRMIEPYEYLPDYSYIEIKAKCHKSLISQLDDSFDITILEELEDEVLITIQAPDLEWISTYLLSLGANLTITSPQTLVDKIKKEINLIISNYNMT